MIFRNCALVLLLCATADAFSPSKVPAPFAVRATTARTTRTTSSLLVLSAEEKKKGGLDGSLRNKLVSESIAPWRTLRLFLYGSAASGAFVGGLINGSGAIAGMNSPEFNLNTELLNVGIDFGAVVLFAALAKFDLKGQAELQVKVDEKIERKKQMKEVGKGMKERGKILESLLLKITVSTDGATREASVRELSSGAKQHMIVVAGPKKACRDALIGANLLKMDFAMSNIMVVPYETDADAEELQSRPSGGFGDRPIYETQAYIARPTGEDWDDYIMQEMADAVAQSGDRAKEEGIAIVIANNGKIIRRGVGTVPWRLMVQELEGEVNPTPEGPLAWL